MDKIKLTVEEKQQEQLRWLYAQLVSAQKRQWFGNINIQIKKGMIDLVDIHETLKPPEGIR